MRSDGVHDAASECRFVRQSCLPRVVWRAAIKAPEAEIMRRIYVALDLEFTGLDPERDEIIEVGMVMFRGDQVLETFSSLVKSHRSLPFKIRQLSGISQAEVDRAPPLRALAGKILDFVQTHPLVGHSPEIDLGFLRRQGLSLQNLSIDTFELATIVLPEVSGHSLAHLAEAVGLATDPSHRALADAMATKDLFLALVERVSRWDPAVLDEISSLARHSDWPLRHVFREVASEPRRGEGEPLWEDRRPQFHAVSGPALAPPEERPWPPLEPTPSITPIDTESLSQMVSPGGLFEQAFPGYEHRPQQVAMLEAVAEAFNLPSHLLVEAGTGVGKSVAYLVPSLYFATQNGRRVVVSSNTINLQDQLYNKDIPDLRRILPIPFTATILKGRNNYLCLRRLSVLRRSGQLTTEQVRLLAKVLAWLPKTKTGDRAELPLVNSDFGVWRQIQATPETCMGDLCPFRRTGECLFYRARARAERAHLVSVNHALLLSDLVLGNRILPEYKYLIIDEAHHLEEQATQQFGLQVSRRDIHAFLVGLSHGADDAPGGLAASVPGLFGLEGVSSTARQAISDLLGELRAQVDGAQRRLHQLFNTISLFLQEHADIRKGQQESFDQKVLLTSGLRTQPDWSGVEIAWDDSSVPFRQLLGCLERLVTHLEALNLGENSLRDEIVQEVKAQLQRGVEMWSALSRILVEPDAGGIYWISISRRDDEVSLHSAPLHVGSILQEKLFAENDCVVLTSATLQTENSFRFIKERLALEDPVELALDSPFHFETSVLLYVPNDLPEPYQPGYQKHVQRAIIELCQATQGRALILFTSNSQLRGTYRAVQRPLGQAGIVVYGQGLDGSRRQILESFSNTPNSVLMGTRSFWEGIDVVGPALSCLVIARLPFSVPTEPVLAARSETFEDPFNQYYLPDAILRFRQGFGRLIRSKDDYGLVVVLDRRLLTRAYGKTFFRSLPRCTARQGPLDSLPGLARRWLDPSNRQ